MSKLFRALAKHSETIESIMLGTCGLVDDKSLQAFEELNQYNLAFETASGTIRLSSSFQMFLDMALKTDKNILSNIDVGGYWRSILHNLDQMNRSESQGAYLDTDMYERSVTDGIYQLIDGVNHNILQLRTRLDNKFGYVNSLSAKRKENEQAIIEARALREALNIIDSAEIYERLPSNSILIRIINVDLIQGKQLAQNELLNALTVLQELLVGFRKLEGRARLVKEFKTFYDTNSEHEFDNLFPLQETAALNPLLNFSKPLKLIGHPDEDNPLQRDALIKIIESLVIEESKDIVPRDENSELDLSEDDVEKEVEATVSQQWINALLTEACNNPSTRLSAKGKHQSDIDNLPLLPTYIDMLYSEWLRLPVNIQKHFDFTSVGNEGTEFNGNFAIQDIEIIYKAPA